MNQGLLHMLVGDAFAGDRKDANICGQNISAFSTNLATHLGDSPSTKCSTVAFVKPDALDYLCRNIVCANREFICYSVIKKKLRIIHKATSRKCLLSGVHTTTILDVAFSKTNSNVLCSVDNGTGAGENGRVAVWTLSLEGSGGSPAGTDSAAEIYNSVKREYPFPAEMVEPCSAGEACFAIARQHEWGIIDAARDALAVTSIDQLSIRGNLGVGNVISGISVSADARQLAVSVTSARDGHRVLVWRGIAPGKACAAHGDVSIPLLHPTCSVNCVRFLNATTISVLQDTEGMLVPEWPECGALISVWAVAAAGSAAPTCHQTVAVPLPTLSNALLSNMLVTKDFSASLRYTLTLASEEGLREKFLLLSSRVGNTLTCFSVSGSTAAAAAAAAAGTAAAGEVAYLSHVCHVDVKVPMLSISGSLISASDHHSVDEQSHVEISCFQEMGPSQQALVQQHHVPTAELSPAPAPAASGAAGLPWAVAQPAPARRPEPEPAPAKTQPIKEVEAAAAAATTAATAALLGALNLNSAERKATAGGAPVTEPVPVPVPAPVPVPVPVQAAVPAAASAARQERQSASTSSLLMGMLKAPANAPATPVAAAVAVAAEPSLDDMFQSPPKTAGSSSVKAQSLLSMIKTAPKADPAAELPPAAAAAAAAAAVKAPTVKVPAASPAAAPAPAPAPKAEAALSPSEASPTPAPAPAPALPVPATKSKAKSAGASNPSPSPSSSSSSGLATEELQAATAAAAPAAVTATATASATAASLGLGSELKDFLRREIQDSVGKQLKDLLRKEVLPAIPAELEKAVLKGCQAQFASAFDKSIIPAFQSGVTEMFRQVQVAFDGGMAKLAQANTSTAQEAMQQMKQTLAGMQGQIRKLDEKIEGLLVLGQSQAAALEMLKSSGVGIAAQQEPEDPLALLAQGLVAEAVEAALEQKNMEITLAVMAQLTPAKVTDHCSIILVLCLTQQLAIDLSQSDPAEGLSTRLDWIKNLVPHILFNADSAGGSSEEQGGAAKIGDFTKVVMRSVKDSIVVAQARVKARILEGGDDEKSRRESSLAVTDLNMLSHFVKDF